MEAWLDAQYSVIGSALIESSLVGTVVTEMEERDFNGPCLTVWNAMRELFSQGRPVDVVTVAAKVGPEYHSFLTQVMEITPTARNLHGYMDICKRQARLSILRGLGSQLAAAEQEDLEGLISQINGAMVSRERYKAYSIVEVMEELYQSLADGKKPEFLSWPIQQLNDYLYAEAGDFIVLGGRPSAGKSALALQCAGHWGRGHRVGFFSLETGQKKLGARFTSGEAGIDMAALKLGRLADGDWQKFSDSIDQTRQRPFDLIAASDMTVSDIRAFAEAKRYDIVIIDYLQLMKAPGSSRFEIVTNISMGLHTLAQDTGMIVVALSQMSRAGGQEGKDRSPEMSALRESGQIENDADIILMLTLADEKEKDGPRNLFVAKNKEGERPAVKLAFDGAHQRFYKLDQSHEVANRMRADGNRARYQTRAPRPQEFEQMPMDTRVPWEDRK